MTFSRRVRKPRLGIWNRITRSFLTGHPGSQHPLLPVPGPQTPRGQKLSAWFLHVFSLRRDGASGSLGPARGQQSVASHLAPGSWPLAVFSDPPWEEKSCFSHDTIPPSLLPDLQVTDLGLTAPRSSGTDFCLANWSPTQQPCLLSKSKAESMTQRMPSHEGGQGSQRP